MRPLSASIKKSLEIATSAYESQLQGDPRQYLQERGISPGSISAFRLGFVSEPISGHEQYRGCISIPYLGPSGVYGLRFRSLLGDGPKYLGLSGMQTRLFNVRDIADSGDTICITEGEFDTIILKECGLYSVGVPGADTWKRHHPRLFAGFRRVLVLGDSDPAGKKFAKTVTSSLPNATSIQLLANDVNDQYLLNGPDSLLELIKEQ